MEEGGGYLVDTPGFSLMELPLMEPEDVYKRQPRWRAGRAEPRRREM